MPETWGERLQRLRLEKKLSQAGLAKESGIPSGTLRGWEQGRRIDPHASGLEVLARSLGVTMDELWKGI